jgi:hypothetical protein
MSITQHEPKKTILKTMVSDKSKDTVFGFFENIKNMELGGAISNVTEGLDGWHNLEHAAAGKSRVKIIARNKELGVLDHLFEGSGLSWIVFVRIIGNGYGSVTTWTFVKPSGLTDTQFEEQLKGFDREIESWNKHIANGPLPFAGNM